VIRPKISVLVGTMHVGGLDVLFDGLCNQTFGDFELVLVDGLHERRQKLVAERAQELGVRLQHLPPRRACWPTLSTAHYFNTALVAARGELVLLLADGTWCPSDLLARHVAHHDEHGPHAGLMGPHACRASPPLDDRMPRYADLHAYVADWRAGRLDEFSWTMLASPFREIDIDSLPVCEHGADAKLRRVAGPIEPSFFHAQNESVSLDKLLQVNGFDERYDGGHGYVDIDLAERLLQAGVQWRVDPESVVHVVHSQRHLPDARVVRGPLDNQRMWHERRAASYPPPISGWSLVDARSPHSVLRTGKFGEHSYRFVQHYDGHLSDHATAYTFVDEEEVRQRCWHFQAGDIVLDVGPAFGSYTLTAAAQGARVVALEPFKLCREILQENRDVNPEFEERIQILDVGLHAERGFFNPDKPAAEAFSREKPTDAADIDLPVVALDELWPSLDLDRLTAVKIDVEAAELAVLRGAEKTIRRHKPRLVVENHEFLVPGIEAAVTEFMEGLGLGYRHETWPHGGVSHTHFWVGTQVQTRQLEFRGKPFRIACIDSYASHPSWNMFEDEAGVRELHWQIVPGDCVLDVGAAYGSYALPALAVGAAHVFAWSPQEQSAVSTSGVPADGMADRQLLRQSLELNGWTDRCDIYSTGVYDRAGWWDTATRQFSESQVSHPDVIAVGTLDAWYRDAFLPRFEPRSFRRYWLKLDVEGAEVAALVAAEQMMRELRPWVCVENHNFKDESMEGRVRALLLGRGYVEVSTIPGQNVSHSLYSPMGGR
jgi:FkbM family methyltransferase